MRAKTHPGSEEHTETSSSDETMKTGKMKREGLDNRGEASRGLEGSRLTAEEVAGQSAYESDAADVIDQAAESQKSKSANRQ
jgi:hypothetical protein